MDRDDAAMKLPCPILLYHSVGDARQPLSINDSDFAQQIEYLHSQGVTGLSLRGTLQCSRPSSAPAVALTFDDGFADAYTTALPILVEHGFHATFFAVANHVDEGRTPWPQRPLDWRQLREMVSLGMEIGSHSCSHPDLRGLTPGALLNEIAGSKARLEDQLGVEVSSFAYPFGYLDAHVHAAVRAAGYKVACAMLLRRSQREDRWALQRIAVTRNDGMMRFRLKLSVAYQRLVASQILPDVRRVMWTR